MIPLAVALLIDAIVFYAVYKYVRDTETTNGICVDCRRIRRAMGTSLKRYACLYRYSVNGQEYVSEDILRQIKKVSVGTETKIYYKKENPAVIISREGIQKVCVIALVGNLAVISYVVLIAIMAYY